MPLAIRSAVTSGAMPTHMQGDLLVSFQFFSHAPATAGWTTVASAATTWNYDAYRVVYRFAASSAEAHPFSGSTARTYAITGAKESAPIAAFGTLQYAAWSNPIICTFPSIEVPGSSGGTNGSAYFLNGYSGYGPANPLVSANKVAATTLGTSDFTIECWLKPKTLASGYNAIYTDRNGNDFSGFQMYANSNGGVGIIGGAGSNWDVNTLNHGASTITLGNWSHVAVTRSGSTWRTFVNGVLLSTATTAPGFSLAQGTTHRIGQDGGAAAPGFDGYISNFRIVKGSALYTSDFTPSGPLTAVAGTGLLTLNTPTAATDSSGNNITVTSSTGIIPNGDSPFGSMGEAIRLSYISGYGGGGNPWGGNSSLTVGGPGAVVVGSGTNWAFIEGGLGPISNMGSPGSSYGGGRAMVTLSINPAPSSGFFSMF